MSGQEDSPKKPVTFPEAVAGMREWLIAWHRRGLLALPRPALPDIQNNAQEAQVAQSHQKSADVREVAAAPAHTATVVVAVEEVSQPQGHFLENRPALEVLEGLERGEQQRMASKPVAAGADLPVPPEEGTRSQRLAAFYEAVGDCRRCGLCKGRTRIVFGSGNPDSGVMVVGEGPGRNEDLEGLPFVGRSGMLLTRMLASVGLDRERDVFITNVVKCRPPNNRDPEPDEVVACRFILQAQLHVIQPKVIVIAGLQAAKALLGPTVTLSGIRQRRQQLGKALVLATYHPSFLLRTPTKKAEAWRDLVALRTLLAELGLAAEVPRVWWS